MWESQITFYTAGQIDLVLSVLLQLFDPKWENFSDIFSLSCAIITGLFYVLLPILMFAVLIHFHKRGELEDKHFTEVFGVLVENLRHDKSGLSFQFVFLFRRTCLCLLILSDNVFVQLMCTRFLALGMPIYIGLVRPYQDSARNV